MSALAASPVLVPLATAMLTALACGRARLQAALSFAGVAVFVACATWLVATSDGAVAVRADFGGWPAPFGIAFRLDPLGAVLVLVSGLVGGAALLHAAGDADPGDRHPLALPLMHGTLAGVGGAFATADLFNLYVWFEVMLICALGLLAIGGRADQLDAAFKYLALNLFGTLLLLAAIGLVYAATGHLNFDALSLAAARLPPELRAALSATLVAALLLKAGAFPFFAWLPASYHTLPSPVLALFAGLLTKVGVYAVLRLLGDVLAPAAPLLREALGWIAVATMILGVLGAAHHWDMRRILAFHIVSQIGYILLAVAIGGAAGNAAAIFYTVHHIVVKASLFLIAGIVFARAGSFDVRRIGGLHDRRPALAALFAIPALSLVGVPPLSGFWAKLVVLQAALAEGRVAWAVAALAVSVLTLYSMMKIWMEAFWRPDPGVVPPPDRAHSGPGVAWIAAGALAAVTIAIGLAPQPLLAHAGAAAAALGRH